LKRTVLVPCVEPKLEPEIVTEAPIPPDDGEIPEMFGVGYGVPAVTDTLAKVAVASAEVVPLVTA